MSTNALEETIYRSDKIFNENLKTIEKSQQFENSKELKVKSSRILVQVGFKNENFQLIPVENEKIEENNDINIKFQKIINEEQGNKLIKNKLRKSNYEYFIEKNSNFSNILNITENSQKNLNNKFSIFELRPITKNTPRESFGNSEIRSKLKKFKKSNSKIRYSIGYDRESREKEIINYESIKTDDYSDKQNRLKFNEKELNTSPNSLTHGKELKEDYFSFMGNVNFSKEQKINLSKDTNEEIKYTKKQIEERFYDLKIEKEVFFHSIKELELKNKEKLSILDKMFNHLYNLKKEINNYDKKIIENKQILEEAHDDRNQLIVAKVNLDNKYQKILKKMPKITNKYNNFQDNFSVKEKNSKNLKLHNISFHSNNSPINFNIPFVSTELDYDECIYELENKLALTKLENGILAEKVDLIEEKLQINEKNNKIYEKKIHSLNFQIDFFQNTIKKKCVIPNRNNSNLKEIDIITKLSKPEEKIIPFESNSFSKPKQYKENINETSNEIDFYDRKNLYYTNKDVYIN